MKKILSILMVAVMVLSLVACGTNDKEEAEKAANGFMDAFCKLDQETVKVYVDDESSAPDFEELIGIEIDKLVGNLPAGFDDYEDELREMVSKFVKRACETLSYEIKEVEEKDGEYNFTVELTAPDMSNSDVEDELAEAINQEKLQQLIQNEYLAGTLTDNSTEKDIYKVIMPEILAAFEEVLEETKIEEETEEVELVVIEQDGKWLIDTEASEIG